MRGFAKKFSIVVSCVGVVSLISACSLFDALDRKEAKEYHKCRSNCVEYCNDQILDHEGYGMCGNHYRPMPKKKISEEIQLNAPPEMQLAPAGGLSFKPLFDDYVANEEQRFRRLERAVQQIRNEVDLIQVTDKVEKEEKASVAPAAPEMPADSASPMSLQPKKSTPVVIPPEPMEEAVYKPAAVLPSASINSIRMADHKNKTRVVLDVTKGVDLPTMVANHGKTLVIDLSNANWNTRSNWLATKGSLISGYRVEGNKLYVDLMYSSKIAKRLMLKPDSKITSHYRLVLDLVSDVVHK